jgi:hypothetical protein
MLGVAPKINLLISYTGCLIQISIVTPDNFRNLQKYETDRWNQRHIQTLL